MKKLITIIALSFLILPAFAADCDIKADPVLNTMQGELKRSFKKLAKLKPSVYFLSYQITDTQSTYITASSGAIKSNDIRQNRLLDIVARVGDYKMDNTRKIKVLDFAELYARYNPSMNPKMIPLDNNIENIKNTLWLETEETVKQAQQDYLKVKTNSATASERSDRSDDFSPKMKAQTHYDCFEPLKTDTGKIAAELSELSALFKGYGFILDSEVSFSAKDDSVYFVSSEGSKIKKDQNLVRIGYYARARNSDGMEMERTNSYDGFSMADMPSKEVIAADILKSIEELRNLTTAQAAEPFHGPAILMNKAAGVFFHEILGHRVEGHRQKDDDFGQTFTQKLNHQILSPILSVYDDPTLQRFNNIPLRGHYKYDDEGVPAQRAVLIQDGVLKGFLMSRNPINGFNASNGHGRKSPGNKVVSRMGVTIVEAKETMPFDRLKAKLKEEIKKQNKPYGLIISDISGGFTNTSTYSPQSFKVTPLLVYKVYADGRPDEFVRGADLVGTPLTAFNKVIAAADDYAVFNGSCGAESGWVPVSAIAPSLLLSEVEVEKVERTYSNLPLLPPPPVKTDKEAKK